MRGRWVYLLYALVALGDPFGEVCKGVDGGALALVVRSGCGRSHCVKVPLEDNQLIHRG